MIYEGLEKREKIKSVRVEWEGRNMKRKTETKRKGTERNKLGVKKKKERREKERRLKGC